MKVLGISGSPRTVFLINEMIVPGSTYWNIGFGREKGEVAKDDEGLQTIKNLAHNMAFVLRKMHA